MSEQRSHLPGGALLVVAETTRIAGGRRTQCLAPGGEA